MSASQRTSGFSFTLTAAAAILFYGIAAPQAADGSDDSADSSNHVSPGRSPPERIVDCLLPGQVRLVGNMQYQRPPRPEQLPGVECQIQGGDLLSYDRADFDTSLAWWVDLAGKGDADAMRYVGEIYERGLGRDPDFVKAASWYLKASDAGNVPAKISLADMHRHGRGVPLDLDRARELRADVFGPDEPPAFDPRTINPPLRELDALRAEMGKQKQFADSLERDLIETEQRLAEATRELDSRRDSDTSSKESLQRLSDEVQRTAAAADDYKVQLAQLDQQNTELAQLAIQLEQKEREAGRLERQLAAAENELDAAKVRLNALAAARQNSADVDNIGQAQQTEEIARLTEQTRVAEQRAREYEQALVELEVNQRSLANYEAQAVEKTGEARQLSVLLSETNSQLEAANRSLASERESARQMDATLEQTRRELARLRTEQSADTGEVERMAVIAAEREVELRRQQSEMVLLTSEVERVRSESEGYLAKLEQLDEEKRRALVDMVGPSIDIIQPKAVPLATRGLEIATISAVASSTIIGHQVVGKVTAPAGLLSLTINNEAQVVNERGVFKKQIDEGAPSMNIVIVAIDSQGKRAEKQLRFEAPGSEPTSVVYSKGDRFRGAFGNYHALLIGNSQYENFRNLTTPRADVDAIAAVLRDKYGFKTTVLYDVTNSELFSVLYKDLLPNLTSEDNLLIYYAGHGDYDEQTKAYTWLPVDAEPDNPQNYFWNDDLTKYLQKMNAKHILVIADSCYSGALTRDASMRIRAGMTDREYGRWLKTLAKKQSRLALTSGGLRPVLDQGGGQHSVFARYIIEVLQENQSPMLSQDLAQQVGARVSYAAETLNFQQEPEWAPINRSGHDGGEFVLLPGT